MDFRTTVGHHASGTIAQTASESPVCSCPRQAALADACTLHIKEGQRAGGHFPHVISLGVNEACPEDTQLPPLLQKLLWISSFLIIHTQ